MLYSLILDYLMNTDSKEKHIHYCDTDSLFCSKEVYNRLKELDLIGNELGQLKDEIPENEIIEFVSFAPKSYLYKLDNGYIQKTFKGTGSDSNKKIVSQSLRRKFVVYDRIALNPHKTQKRVLIGNYFENRFGKSEKLIEVWEKYQKEENIEE